MIQVIGRLQNRRWKDKYEQARVSTEFIADNIYFGDNKGKDGDSGGLPDGIDPFGADASQSGAPAGFNPFA